MCGFSGLLTANHQNPKSSVWKNQFSAASQKIAHRGTDDARLIHFGSLSLHHFRLAFQDIEAGRQPMMSNDGQWAITFNGEIYNHLALRRRLEDVHGPRAWRTHSDTETLLQGWLLEGETFVDSLEGEFAFVICRSDASTFFAARDNFGVKPLFLSLSGVNTRQFAIARSDYQIESDLIAFASEMKALPGEKRWNRDGALRQFVGLFEPICTPFEEIIQCPPGGRVLGHKVKSADEAASYRVQIKTRNTPIRDHSTGAFWSTDNLNDKLAEFRGALSASVEERLLSDVELGVYLSGGIDSKAVAFELNRNLKKQSSPWLKHSLKSFTVGFETTGYDESAEAVAFSRHLGFQPHVLRLSESALRYSYPHAVYISENLQPFTNGAAKWWLSLFARQYVPGVLTGDGADELLCGYPSFRYCAWWSFSQRKRLLATPLGARWRDSVFIKKFSAQFGDPWLAGSSAEGRGDDFELSLALWGVPHPLFGQISTITRCILGDAQAQDWLASQAESIRSWFWHGMNPTQQQEGFSSAPENALLLWQNYFCHTHLPVQILNWVGDRMEMANTLEGRTPFLSGRLRQLVRQLPNVSLVQGFLDKAILRKAYVSELPRSFMMTPKKQFNAPFLDFNALCHDYDVFSVLKAMDIDPHGEKTVRALLGESHSIKTAKLDPAQKYIHTHRMSALQTLICSAIVQRSIVESQPAERNLSFESEFISRGGQAP